MKQHVKCKDKAKQEKVRMMNATSERTPMPRPTVFRDKTKYNRQSFKKNTRQMAAYC